MRMRGQADDVRPGLHGNPCRLAIMPHISRSICSLTHFLGSLVLGPAARHSSERDALPGVPMHVSVRLHPEPPLSDWFNRSAEPSRERRGGPYLRCLPSLWGQRHSTSENQLRRLARTPACRQTGICSGRDTARGQWTAATPLLPSTMFPKMSGSSAGAVCRCPGECEQITVSMFRPEARQPGKGVLLVSCNGWCWRVCAGVITCLSIHEPTPL